MAGLEVDERAPLLKSEDEESQSTRAGRPPPLYDGTDNISGSPAGHANDPLPPPYTPMPSVQINCKVCLKPINIEDRQHLHVVKCSFCNEATPIKAPPSGKKYVRCPCNCLLVCNATSMKIACPRANCRRIITLSPTDGTETAETVTERCPDTLRVNCFACNNIFLFPIGDARRRLARCPHCRRFSSVGPHFARRRASLFALIGVIFLIMGTATVAATTHLLSGEAQDRYFYIMWIAAFIIGMCSIIRAVYFCCIKVSHIERAA